MKQTKFNLALFLVALSAIVVLAATPVFAHSNSDDSTSNAQQSDDGDKSDGSSRRGHDGQENEKDIKNKASMFRRDGTKKLVLERAHKMHNKNKAQRAKTCQNIQKAVNNKLKAFNGHTDKYLARLDDLFVKIQSYQTEHKLSVGNYDALVATATQKQANAAIAVAALKSLGMTLDCKSSDPASTLSSVKAGAAAARDALKDYRKSLKSIVVALVQADKTDATTKTEVN